MKKIKGEEFGFVAFFDGRLLRVFITRIGGVFYEQALATSFRLEVKLSC